jgi:hypothetical protein
VRRLLAQAIALSLACARVLPADAAVKAWLDRSRISEGDTVQLTLEHDGRTSGQPDLAPLQGSFDILGTSTSTNVDLVNGSFSEHTDVELTLAPKRAGTLTVPPLSWDGERTAALTLVVAGPGGPAPAGAAGVAGGARVFIESRIHPRDPYVQAAVALTVRLFTAEPLYRGDLELAGNTNLIVKRIGSDEVSHVERNGRSYREITRHYLLFPLRSGSMTVSGPVLDAEIAVAQRRSAFGMNPFRGFFGGSLGGMLQTTRPIRVHGQAITLTVRPRPAAAMGRYWLPARKVALSAHWDPAGLTAQAGNPVTLDLDLRATGLTAAQLPQLSTLLHVPSGVQAYPDQARLHDSTRNGTVVGSSDQSIALIADRPGRYALPPLTVRWWDTAANRLREASLPAQTLRILPAPAGAPAPPAFAASASAPAQSAPAPRAAVTPGRQPAGPASPATARLAATSRASSWKWATLGLAALWILTLLGWAVSRRRKAPPGPTSRPASPPAPRPDPAAARAAFIAACRRDDALAARRHLLAWAAGLWGSAPSGLNAIAARTGDPRSAELLRDLDRACYVGGDWHGQALAEALPDLPKAPGRKDPGRKSLEPLYR